MAARLRSACAKRFKAKRATAAKQKPSEEDMAHPRINPTDTTRLQTGGSPRAMRDGKQCMWHWRRNAASDGEEGFAQKFSHFAYEALNHQLRQSRAQKLSQLAQLTYRLCGCHFQPFRCAVGCNWVDTAGCHSARAPSGVSIVVWPNRGAGTAGSEVGHLPKARRNRGRAAARPGLFRGFTLAHHGLACPWRLPSKAGWHGIPSPLAVRPHVRLQRSAAKALDFRPKASRQSPVRM